MKHLMKKGLSLLLAVLMVTSMLPMSALAAAMRGDADTIGQREEATIGEADPIVDTHAGMTSDRDNGQGASPSDRPEIPDIGDEDDKPVDPTWYLNGAKLEIDSNGDWKVTVNLNDVTTTTGGSGAWAVAIVPDVAVSGRMTVSQVESTTSTFASGQNDNVGDLGGLINGFSGLTAGTHFKWATASTPLSINTADNTIVFDSSISGYEAMPAAEDLRTALGNLAADGQIPVRAVVLIKGADLGGGIHSMYAVSDTFMYGEVASLEGIPSTTYILNKSDNTLTYVSGTIDGKPWTNPNVTDGVDANSSWNDGSGNLSVPVYNTFADPVGVDVAGPTPPVTNVSGGTLTDRVIYANANAPVTVNIGTTVTSGTIVLPVTAYDLDESGDPDKSSALTTATITIQIINSAYTADAIEWTVEEGYDVATMSDATKTIKFNKPASATNVVALTSGTAAAALPSPAFGADEVTIPSDAKVQLNTSSVAGSHINATTVRATAMTWEAGTIGTNGRNEVVESSVGLDLLEGLTVGTYQFQVSFTLRPITKATRNYTAGTAQTIQVPVKITVTPKQVEPENHTFTLTYNLNGAGASGGPNNETHIGTETSWPFTPAMTPAPTRTGYVFKGWADNAGDTTPDYTGTQTVTADTTTPNKIVYAVWAKVYTVKYQDSATATDPQLTTALPSDSTKYESGESHTVPNSSPAIGDEQTNGSGLAFTFAGWQPTGATTSTKVDKGGTVTFDASDITMTATWTPVKVSVTYDYDDGTTPDTVILATDPAAPQKGGSYTIGAADPTWVGHTFLGWEVTGGTASADPLKTGGSVDTITGDVTLTAKWQSNKYSVTFNTDGGTWSSGGTGTKTTEGEYTDKVTVPVKADSSTDTVTKEGYTFAGWFETNASGDLTTTELDTASHTYGVKDKMVYKAKWTLNSHTLTWDGNGGGWSGTATQSETKSYGASITAYGTEPTRTNYVFAGWYTAAGSAVDFTGLTMPDHDVTYYAHWTEVYTVKYSANGKTLTGSVSLPGDETELAVGDSTTGANVTLSTTGWTFAGWNTKADGSGTNVATNAQYTVAAADAVDHVITLYAKWTQGESTIHYDWNYTGSAITDHTGKTGATDTPPAAGDAPTNTGYTWDGKWYTTAACATEQTTFAFPAATGGEVTYYANWTHDAAKVTFDTQSGKWGDSYTGVDASGNDVKGTATASVVDGHYHDALTAPTVANSGINRFGYTFRGWATSAGSSSASDAVAVKTKLGEAAAVSATYYAIWEPIIYKVTYNDPAAGKSGATMPGQDTITAGAVTLHAPTNVQTGWHFVNWKVQGGTDTYDGTDSVTGLTGDLTLDAQWTVDVTYVSTYGNKPTDLTGATAVPYNTDITIDAVTAKTGDTFTSDIYTNNSGAKPVSYRFNGWKAAPAGNISKTAVGATDATVTGPVTLTADWVGQSSVAYDVKGGNLSGGASVPTTAQTGDVSTPVPAASKPSGVTATTLTKTGHTFGGWSTTDGGTTPVDMTSITYPATAGETTTYYAIWNIDQYTVTYANGGHGTVANAYAPMTAKVNYMADYTPVVAANVAITGGGTWESSNTIFNDGTQKWLFKGWEASGGTASGTYQAGGTVEDLTGNLLLTATWEEVFVVSFDSKGGSNSPAAQQGVDQTKITLPDPGTKADAEFTGWYDGTTRVGGKGDQYTITKTVTLTAGWDGTSKVKFDLDGGAPATGKALPDPNPMTGKTGTAVVLPGTMIKTAPDDATKTGYTFRGWSVGSKSTSASDAVDLDTIKFPANAGDTDTYYAIWVPDVTVTFNANTGAWSDGSTKSSAGEPGVEEFTVPADPAKDGYAFKGWFDAASGGTAVGGIDAGTDHTYPAANKIYYAQWDKLYTVKYDVNDPTTDTDKFVGAVTADSTKDTTKVPDQKLGDKVTVPKMEDTKGNYVFKGWVATSGTTLGNAQYTVADGDAAGTVDPTEHQFVITLTARWQPKTNVTYNTGAGAWATAPSGGTTTSWSAKGDPTVSTDTYTVPADPARSGYDFAGWLKTGDTAVDSSKTAGATPRFPAADETYTAQWKVKQYKVKFVWNTTAHNHTLLQEVTGSPTTGDFGAVITTPTTNPSMVGYTFGGWYKDEDCSDGQELVVTGEGTKDTYPANDDMVVYAKWTANKHHIYYHVNSGGGSGATIATADASVEFTYAETPVKKAAAGTIITGTDTGWNFTGWSTAAGVQTVAYAANADLPTDTTDADINLYAQWTVNVTFHGNPPTGTTVADPGIKTTTPGGTLAAADYNAPATLTDYTFAGWFDTDAATGGTQYTAASTYPAPKDLYARWTPVEYTYTFDPNGGAFPNGTAGITTTGGIGTAIPGPNDGAATPATVDPVWKDHTFKGWNATKADASAGTADSSLPDATMPSGGKTIYAAWTENTYKYNFDANKGTWGGTPEVTVQTKTGKAGATVTAPDPAPTYTDGSGRNYRFDGWSTVKDDASKKITTFTITGNANDGDVTDTVYALWTPLYTITYAQSADFSANIAQPTNPSQTDVPAGTYNAAAPYTNTAAGAYISATGGSWDGTVRFNTADGKHWKFEGWTPDGGTTKINAGGNVTISNADITLTAMWTQEYKVTMKDGVRADETTSAGNAGGKLNGSSSITWSHAATPYIYVSGPFGVADAQLLNNNSDHVFVKWMATNTGAFTGGDTESTNATDTFTPTGDTELTPVFAKKPGLTPAVDGYQLNFATDAAVPAAKWQPGVTPITKPTNTLPAYTWDKGDATIGDVTIQKAGDTSATTLTEGTHYTYDSTTGVIEFQRAYLLGLEATKSYTVTVKSTTNGVNTDKTATLWAVVTPDDLLRVEIGVKPDRAADYETGITATPVADRTKSASVTVEARDQVKYLDHAETTIIPSNLLTYQWYYAPGPSTPDRHTAVGNLALPTGAVAIGTSTTDNFVDMDNDIYKGKYIFATVVATGTGKDAVVTNSIPVDYDAVIAVNKDGVADTTDGAYTVYLVPQPATGSNAATYTAANLPATKVATTHTASTNQYATATSALTGGVTYDVYVNRLEGDASIFVKTDKTVSTQVNANAANKPTLDFWSVNAVGTDLLHKQDANHEFVGESFGAANADAPTTEFYADGIATKFDSGKGVFTGTKVTAKASKTWTQDYDVNWGMKEDTATTAPTLTYVTDNQAATGTGNAVDTGKDYANIKAKTWIGAQLEQNVYTITGNVWVNGYTAGSRAGIVATGSVPTLEYVNATTGKTYLFKATVNNNGVHQSTVTFTGVPRSSQTGGAIAGKYVVTATEKPSDTKSTIKKYIPGQDVSTATDTSIAGVGALTDRTLAADVVAGGVTGPMFTVVVEGSTYSLKAADQEPAATQKSAIHTLPGTPTTSAPSTPSGNRLATQPWTGTYAGITAKTYTIDVTNEGNMPLDVTLNIKRTLDGTDVIVYGPDKAGTDDLTASGSVWTDSDNGVTFGALQQNFSLAAKGDAAGKDKVTFTVTIPDSLTVNSAADYAFELTSKEGALYGPSVTYKLTQKVTPLKITDIQVKSAGTNAWQPDALAIDSSTTIPTGVDQSAEVEYKWYVAPTTSSNVALNKTGTGTLTGTGLRSATASGVSGNTYTLAAADQGMSLYLVAHNKDTGNIIEADFVKVADLPYDLEIQVNEDSDPTANKGNYTVYLWPTTGGTFDKDDAKAISATATAAADGRYKATGLVPGTTYDIYTNAVGGTADHYQKSGTQASLTDFTGKNVPIVTYRSVTINNTTTDNSPYSFADSTDPFLKDADGTTTTLDGTLKKPTATLKGAATKVADPDAAASKWVQAGTEITVTYPAWIKDYTLSWDVGSDVTNAAANASGDVTVNTSTTIDSELTLNVYQVTLTVDGPGTLSEVKMNDGTRDFTATAGSFHATGATVPPIGKGSYTFTVPKGTYTVEGTGGTGTDILYYKIPASSSDTITPDDIASKNISVSDDTSSFHIQLNSVGQYMLVEDDQKPVDNAAITAHASGTAGWTGTTKTDGTAGSTIHLPYGYTAAKTVTVTVANNSAENNHLYDLTWTPAATGNSASITAAYTDLDGSNNLMYPYGGTVDSPLTATLTVATGLDVGTHTYTADVSFSTADGGDTTPTVTYTLTVVVDATKFTNVTVVDEDGATVTNVDLGKDLKFNTYTTATVDDWTAKTLVADTDYTYQWYHGPANKTATESWDKDAGVSVTDATAISGATSATLAASEIAKYPGEHIYLVISAVKDKNVIEAAISAPITTGFQPVVKVEVDGVDQSTVAGFDGTGYTVTIDNGTKTWNTAWSAAKAGFVPVESGAEVSLDATGEYTAKVSRVQGDGTNLVALSDKLKNTTTDDTVTAEYFTVNTVETKAFEGITGLGEDFGGTDKRTGPALGLALADNTALTTGTPVLKNQSVVAKAADWTQDYELTWYTRMDGAATVPTRDTAYEGTPTMTARGGKVDHTSASGTGYTVNQVTNKLYVGGRLDQITYTIVGTVAGTGTVGQVALEQTAPKGANYIYPDTTTPPTSPVKPTSTASVTDGPLAKDETVTFTVVKGTFTITPTEGANTVIKKVSWEGTDVTPAGTTVIKDKLVQLKADPANRRYDFVVTVEGADIKLKVSDDVAAPNTTSAESDPNAWNDDTNGVERYFNYLHFKKTDSAAGDTYEYALKLTNAGNKAVKVNAEVYHFDTAPATGFGVNAATWAATKATGTKVYQTADGATANLTGASGKTVLSLSDMLGADTVVDAKSATTGTDGSADAGKITLGTDAWSKDSGAYVFHFMGVTNDTDAVAVDVYYVLDLTIDQLPIVGVATNNDGTTMVGVGDTITVKGYDATADKSLENVTVQTSTQTSQTANAAAANLTGNDVHFAWVKMTAGATLAKTDLSVVGTGANAGTLASDKGSVVSQGRTYTLVDGDQDSDFYLVAFAPNYTGNVTNATDLVIASVVKAKRTAGVKVSLNGYQVTGTTDPGYAVYLVESGKTFDADHTDGSTGTWATAWNAATNRYEAAIDVDNKTYEVYAVTYKGGATVLKAIDGTLGKQTPTGTKTEETVPYWNVTFTEDVAVTSTYDGFKSYLPNGAAGTDNAIQKALSVKVSTTKGGSTYEANALTASTTATATTVPVLEGMNVQVTVDATRSSDNTTADVKKSWSETDVQSLHTLTATGWTNSADNKASGIGYADSIVSNAVLVSTSAKTFSAKLDQVLFDVEFTVKDISEDADGDPAPSAKTKVRQVTLVPDTGRGETGSYSAVSAVGSYGNTDTVTITGVPAGSFEVKATAVPGTPTLVKGYTWNATGDALNTPIDPGKIVVVVGGADADDTNKHAGNTIQTIEATKVVNWSHTFDEQTGGILADGAFAPSNGFVKADDTNATPKKLFGLTEGYAESKGDVLKYTVRVANGGTDDMTGFYLTRTADSDLSYDLTKVTWHKADGTEVKDHDATTKFTLGPGDYLEFPMIIPEGKAAQRDNYKTEITPNCDLNAGETLGGGKYAPEYQVKSPVKFKPGEALVLYGGSTFESNTDIALDWPTTTDETKPTFTYEVLALDGVNDAAILKEINDALGLSLTTLDAKPTWLTHDNTTGAITISAGAHADTVNVKVKGTPADFAAYDNDANGHKVDNEVTLYLRATDDKTALTYVIPYVVDVEPGQLDIDDTADFAPADPVGGQSVDKSEFTYLKVTNRADTPLDVVPALIPAGTKQTGAGNDPSQETPTNGKVFVDNAEGTPVHTATWTVDPTSYVGDVATDYVFTVTYKPDNAVEKWNYRPDTYTKKLTANKPPLGLTFSDVLGRSSIEPADAEVLVGKGTSYSDNVPNVKPEYAPSILNEDDEAFRKGEYIVYLDTEPKYIVTITATGDLHDVEVEQALTGFKVVKGDLSFTTLRDGEKKTFELELAPVSGNKWVGLHTAKFTVTGTGESGDTTSATYELDLTVKPKVIAEAHVTDLDDPEPGKKPDTTITVTAKDPEGKDIEPGTPDKHGNIPIVPDVKWTPTDDPFQDGKDYKVTVELPADPNYTFKDQKQPEEIPNYTLNGKTDVNDDPALEDEDLTVWVTTESDPPETDRNKQVTFEKVTKLPKKSHLEFEDVNANDPSDRVPHSPAAVRQTITVRKGESLGKYLIKLGAYDNTVTGVTVTEAEKKLPGGYTLDLTAPDRLGDLYQVQADTDANKKVYTLDLTGVDTAKIALGSYALKLKATGDDPYGAEVTATYEIAIQVVKAPAPTLMFDDVNRDNERDVTAPAVDAKRTITVKEGDKLGRYTINLGSYEGVTYNTQLTSDSDIPSNSIYVLSADCAGTKLVPLPELDKASGKNWTFLDLDLSDMDTSTTGTHFLVLKAVGVDINGDKVEASYTLTIRVNPKGGGSGGGGSTSCPNQVTYLLGLYGTTDDPTMEVVSGTKVKTVPEVTAVAGYKFLGWSLTGPSGNAEEDAKRTLVDPKAQSITGDTVFYAVYQPVYAVPKPPIHNHYVIGYPNGNFGPADNIDRASVATIIARAVLPNFVEGADYGNPGGYSDVNGHWAASAIAYCSKYGVFNGYTDGTFKPNQPISRQELALVIARISGVQTGGSVPFTDIDDAGAWAKDGIYTAYANGWVNGYTDGTFKPLASIRRDETVKIFNAYLGRGVDAEGLKDLTEYVHSGVASNIVENGTSEYMTWPDVTKDQWAYYEIIEAANDHEFTVDDTQPKGYAVPEQWTKCWIDEKWRYHDDANDGGPNAVVSALLKKLSLAD